MPDVFTVFLNKDDDDDDHRTPHRRTHSADFSISIKRFKNDICATIYTE